MTARKWIFAASSSFVIIMGAILTWSIAAWSEFRLSYALVLSIAITMLGVLGLVTNLRSGPRS